MFKLSNRSCNRLVGVHPLLAACVVIGLRSHSEIDFGVGAGAVRTIDEQEKLVSDGKSKTMKSKHLIQKDGFSHAVDIYPSGYTSIDETPEQAWVEVVNVLDYAAEKVGIELIHGYDWGWDSPHHEIKRIL